MMIALLLAAAAPNYELVARWPDAPESNYKRIYATKAACDRAAEAILNEYYERIQLKPWEEAALSQRGAFIAAPPPKPVAVCVPL